MNGRLDLASHLLLHGAALLLAIAVATRPDPPGTLLARTPARLTLQQQNWLHYLAQRQALQVLDLQRWQRELTAQAGSSWRLTEVALREVRGQPTQGWVAQHIEATLALELHDETALDQLEPWLKQWPGALHWSDCAMEPTPYALQVRCVVNWHGVTRLEAKS
ncbi:hypothetical protein JCM19000A_35660 [Silvimonas sp. JCM 19000]